jgi:YgiT-type zinc finger domain-containing protein
MRCQSPGCTAELESRTISHSILHRERTLVIHGVPADVCTDCGAVRVAEETILHIDHLLTRKARSKRAALVYEA